VTNFHVFRDTNAVAFVGMTRQARVQPVTEILAASRADDVAIIRIAGLGLRPIALRDDAPVGTPVTLISHPQTHFFSFTQGAIARYSRQTHNQETRFLMEITADFGKGSSGAAILDDRGNAIGMVASTRAVLADNDKFGSMQMVFKECIPAACIRTLIAPTRK
jgi:serine protease Do